MWNKKIFEISGILKSVGINQPLVVDGLPLDLKVKTNFLWRNVIYLETIDIIVTRTEIKEL